MSNSESVAIIQLNRGFGAKVDAEDYERASAFRWSVLETGGLFYARRTVRIGGKQKTVLLHRFILDAADGQIVDHINGDPLDCRKENMRFVNKAQNTTNSRARSNNKLGIKGVSKHSLCNKFVSQIKTFDGRRIYLGLFDTVEQAEDAYRNASIKYHGEYRRK